MIFSFILVCSPSVGSISTEHPSLLKSWSEMCTGQSESTCCYCLGCPGLSSQVIWPLSSQLSTSCHLDSLAWGIFLDTNTTWEILLDYFKFHCTNPSKYRTLSSTPLFIAWGFGSPGWWSLLLFSLAKDICFPPMTLLGFNSTVFPPPLTKKHAMKN